jgi:hypothetical protein
MLTGETDGGASIKLSQHYFVHHRSQTDLTWDRTGAFHVKQRTATIRLIHGAEFRIPSLFSVFLIKLSITFPWEATGMLE